jgi:hypothetical protein
MINRQLSDEIEILNDISVFNGVNLIRHSVFLQPLLTFIELAGSFLNAIVNDVSHTIATLSTCKGLPPADKDHIYNAIVRLSSLWNPGAIACEFLRVFNFTPLWMFFSSFL